jgi:hypothetical protein
MRMNNPTTFTIIIPKTITGLQKNRFSEFGDVPKRYHLTAQTSENSKIL